MTPNNLSERLEAAGLRQHHRLYCWPTYFRAVEAGQKPYEVRKNDRFFQCGDTVTLVELHKDEPRHSLNRPTGKELTFTIGPVLQGGQFGIEPGYCVFALLAAVPARERER